MQLLILWEAKKICLKSIKSSPLTTLLELFRVLPANYVDDTDGFGKGEEQALHYPTNSLTEIQSHSWSSDSPQVLIYLYAAYSIGSRLLICTRQKDT